MTEFLGYIKNIGFFLILMSVVCNAMPGESYKKYCRLFCGLVLVVLVINPFYEFLNYDGDIKDIFVSNNYQSQLNELENQLYLQQRGIDEQVINQYEQLLISNVSGIVKEAGLYLADVKVQLDDKASTVELRNITLYVTDEYRDSHEYKERYLTSELSDEKIQIDKITIGQEVIDNPSYLQIVHNISKYLSIDESMITIEEV